MSVLKILIVEDDKIQAETLSDYLVHHNMQCNIVYNMGDALKAANSVTYDAFLTDLGLPDGEGMDLIKELRSFTMAPIIVLSGRNTELDRVLAIELGADDYMSKPLQIRELVARIKSILKRRQPMPVHEDVDCSACPYLEDKGCNDLTLFLTERRLLNATGKSLELSPVETETFLTLLNAKGRTVSRNSIMDDLESGTQNAFDRSVDITIARLRKKLSGFSDDIHIETTRGVGYRMKTDYAIKTC